MFFFFIFSPYAIKKPPCWEVLFLLIYSNLGTQKTLPTREVGQTTTDI